METIMTIDSMLIEIRFNNHMLIVYKEDYTRVFSYDVCIIHKPCDDNLPILLDSKFYKYSRQTVKHRNDYLHMTSKEIEEAIKKGSIVLTDLNKTYDDCITIKKGLKS